MCDLRYAQTANNILKYPRGIYFTLIISCMTYSDIIVEHSLTPRLDFHCTRSCCLSTSMEKHTWSGWLVSWSNTEQIKFQEKKSSSICSLCSIYSIRYLILFGKLLKYYLFKTSPNLVMTLNTPTSNLPPKNWQPPFKPIRIKINNFLTSAHFTLRNIFLAIKRKKIPFMKRIICQLYSHLDDCIWTYSNLLCKGFPIIFKWLIFET